MVEKIKESFLEVLKKRGISFETYTESVPIQSLYATKESINSSDFERVLKFVKTNNVPILVQQCCDIGKERAIIDGHARALACRKLGKKRIDALVIYCKDDSVLTENLGRLGFRKVYQIPIV